MEEYLIVAFDPAEAAYKLIFTTDNDSSPRDPATRQRLIRAKTYKLVAEGPEFRDRMYGYLWQYFDIVNKCFKCDFSEIERYIDINATFFKEFRNILVLA